MDYVAQAKNILKQNIYMVISSASAEGKPWISPVFFAYDDTYNLFWVSNKEAHHSALVRSNSQIAIVVFESTAPEGKADAVYFEATAKELADQNQIAHGIDIFNARVTEEQFKIKKIEEVTGEGVWRIYQATPVKTYKLGEGTYVNGQYVDTKIEINL